MRCRHDRDMLVVEQLSGAEAPIVGLVVHEREIELRVEERLSLS